jgi:hypothetical protein
VGSGVLIERLEGRRLLSFGALSGPQDPPAQPSITLTNAFIAGKIGNALSFTAVNNNVDADMGNPPDHHLDLGANATIETWMKFDSIPDGQLSVFIGKDDPSTGNRWAFGYAKNAGAANATEMMVTNPAAGADVWFASTAWTPVLGQWYHLAVVKSGNNYTFYKDGVANGTASLGFAIPTVDARLTLGQIENTRWFKGALDDVRLWNTARTATQISSNRLSELTGSESDLAGYWKMNEAGGASIADASANHATGYLYGLTGLSVPALSSRPGAAASIFLDFDGDYVGTWGVDHPGTIIPYDNDGNLLAFSAVELSSISSIWARVAEFYSPFDINVTTVEPASFGPREAVHVEIGGDGAWAGQVGGIAFVGGFNAPDYPGRLCFVFPAKLGNGDPKAVADVCGHESGHVLGLQHTVPNGDAQRWPLMGNAWNSVRALWWYGAAPNENPVGIQDDLALLTDNVSSAIYKPGRLSNAVSMDLVNTGVYADAGDPPDNHLDIGASATVETWVKFDVLPTNNFYTFIAKDVAAGNLNKWIFGYANNFSGVANATIFHINGVNGSVMVRSNAWTPVIGQWYHLAVVKSGTSYTFYRDGVADGTSTSINVPDVNGPVTLGQCEGSFHLAGALDDVRVWNVARSAAQIQAASNSELVGSEGGLVGYWKLNEAGGTTLADSSPYHVNAVVSIASAPNAFGYRADDVGNTAATATPLNVSGGSLSGSGLIENIADVDYFTFEASPGPATFKVTPEAFSGMLDATLELRSAGGTLMASSATSALAETISATLAAGSYRLVVRSAGNYGDIGQYTISGTVQPDVNAPTVQGGSMEFETSRSVRIVFSEPIKQGTVAPTQLTATNLRTNQTFTASSVQLESTQAAVVWTFTSALSDGAYDFYLAGGSTTDMANNALSSAFDLQGTGVFILAGDANHDGVIGGDDFFAIDAGFASQVGGFSHGDFDYNGRVDADDYWLIDANYNKAQSIPAAVLRGESELPPAMREDVMTRVGDDLAALL